MADLRRTCRHNPCPICGDASAKCRIDEYGYIALCKSDAKIGDLRETWLCYRISPEYSQWKDQRVAFQPRYQEQKGGEA